MPRIAKKSVDEIFESLKDLNFFDDRGEILRLTNAIWQTAEKALNGELSMKYIYLYVSQDRNGILKRFRQKYNINKDVFSESTGTINTSNESNNSNTSNWSMSPCALKPWRTIISLDKQTWHKISECGIEDIDKCSSLRPGWTDIIFNEIWKQLKIPCCYTFKSAKINRNAGEIFLKIKGKCPECGAFFNAYSLHEPNNEDTNIQIHISTFDTTDIVHKKKRQLRKPERSRVVKDLRAMSAYGWRREKANEIMSFGDVEPAHLYNETVLRKAKQTDNDEKLGVNQISDPIASILSLKYKPEFSGIIREIGLDKFFVIYFSPEQLLLYQQFHRQTQKAGILSIDATGSVVKKIKKPDGSTNFLFLYQAVVPFKSKILPVVQMISEKHDTNILTYWLREWLRSGAICPKEVVTDYSFALLNAVALAFNNCDLGTYVENCLTILQNNDYNNNFPKCIIRIDIAHLIKLVCRWKCFNDKHARIKDFYVRCAGILSKITTFDHFNQICLDILTVAFSETEDISETEDMNNITITCFKAQQRLLQIIKSNDFQYYNENIRDEHFDETLDYDSGNRINNLLRDFETNSKKVIHSGDRPNPYYCPSFGTNLLRILKEFPLWTTIMPCDKTSVASSARSEQYFNEIKNIIFKGMKNIRADKFIISHIRSLAGTMKILNADTTTSDESNEFLNNSEVEIHECYTEDDNTVTSIAHNSSNKEYLTHPTLSQTAFLNEVETWKGQKDKALKRGKYLRVCPDIESIHKKPRLTSKIPLLQNGNVLRPQNISGQYVMLRNTCAFDSIVQSLLIGYRDWIMYHEYINNTSNIITDFIKMISTFGTL